MGAPPGGPVDKIAPEIMSTDPLPNATNVDPSQPVYIEFDEPIRAESVAQAFSLSPPPPGTVRGKWKGNRLAINFDPPLNDNQTYVIVFGTQLSDQRGNKLENSISLAFSTGDELDQGRLEGHLVQLDEMPVQGWRIAGYFLEKYEKDTTITPDPSVQIPDAATQASADGFWELQNLREGKWRVFAYEDRDEDLLWTPGLDKLAVPSRDMIAYPGGESEYIVLVGSERPATPFPMRTSAFTRDLVFLRFDRALEEINGLLSVEYFNVVDGENGKISSLPEEVKVTDVYIDPADSNRLRIHLAEEVNADSLRVLVSGSFGGPEFLDTSLVAGLEYALETDTIAPSILTIIPEEMSRLFGTNNSIDIFFSEEIGEVSDSAVFINTENDTLEVDIQSANPFHFALEIPDTLKSEILNVLIFGERIKDLSGNTLEDSVITAKYSRLPSDSLGTLTGTIESGGEGQISLKLLSSWEKNPDLKLTIEQPGEFSFENVPAGNWFLSGWQDRDLNSVYSIGEAYPYLKADPYSINFDTLHVRARWESGEVKLSFPD